MFEKAMDRKDMTARNIKIYSSVTLNFELLTSICPITSIFSAENLWFNFFYFENL